MRLNSKQIGEYTGGRFIVDPIDASTLACGITWDSREVKPGDVYVALPGERVDGHRFVSDALRSGAQIILVVDKPDAETCLLAKEMGAAVIEVSNTANAITDIARAWRTKLRGHIVAITGSSGKTTTKNLTRDVLKASFSVVATEGNQNNELGVPKTILAADPETQVIVVEMGMRGRGQITALCDFVSPDMGLITNIGEGHIELLGSKDNIARAKAELFEALPDGIGKAFMNRSDAYADFMQELIDLESRMIQIVWYDGSGALSFDHGTVPSLATKRGAEASPGQALWGVWADNIELDMQGRPCFTMHLGDVSLPCTLPLRGAHNVHNATAAASVGAALGMELSTIIEALEQSVPECGRQEIVKARGGFTIVNDSYNANPDSMRAALMMFTAMEVPGRHIAVLGDMGELGDFAPACHEGIGELVATLPIDRLICIGELSDTTVKAALRAGMPEERIKYASSVSDILEELDTFVLPGDAVLVKASRFMGLERVVGGLVN